MMKIAKATMMITIKIMEEMRNLMLDSSAPPPPCDPGGQEAITRSSLNNHHVELIQQRICDKCIHYKNRAVCTFVHYSYHLLLWDICLNYKHISFST